MSFTTRARVAALAASLALFLSLVAAPAVVAQGDSPEDAVQGLLADIEAANFDAIGGWFCAEFADQAASLDMSGMAASLPPGVDTATVLEAFAFEVVLDSIETISQSDTEAVVKLVAQLNMNIDVTLLEPLIVAVLEAGGQEATPDMIALVGGMMASEIGGEALDISEEIVVVPNEDGNWGKICSELGGDDEDDEDEDMDDGSDADDMDDADDIDGEGDGE